MESVPLVDPYSELGKLRSKSELGREYQRLLERDKTSFSFLYQGDFKVISAVYIMI